MYFRNIEKNAIVKEGQVRDIISYMIVDNR